MRICLLTPEFPPFQIGGIGTYVATLARAFGAAGHSVDVVGCQIHEQPGLMLQPWGRSISLGIGHDVFPRLLGVVGTCVAGGVRRGVPLAWRIQPRFRANRHLLTRALAIREYIQTAGAQYDVIEYSNWPGEAALLPRRRSVPYVVRLSTSAADTAPSAWLQRRFETRAVRGATVVITHSEAMQARGRILYGDRRRPWLVIPPGLADRPLQPPPAGDSLVFASVGRSELRKGTDLLLRALARILPDFPQACYWSIGPNLPTFLDQHPDLALLWNEMLRRFPGRVRDVGLVSEPEKDRLVGAAHWVVAPSRFESFGLMAVEAMRSGTPVVYARAGGLAEVGSRAAVNVGVAPDSVDALEQALRHVCAAGVVAALAARVHAREGFTAHFSADTMARETLNAYRSARPSPLTASA